MSVQMTGPAPQVTVQLAKGGTLLLRAGDRLADGVVKSVGSNHVIVVAELAVPDKPPPKRLLRFTLPQLPPPITLGHDTTRITSPLLPDGTPDYGKWLNLKYGVGITPESNAAPVLETALAGLVDAGQTFWDGVTLRGEPAQADVWSRPSTEARSRIMTRPWIDEDCRACVQRLESNEKALAAVAEATRRSRFYQPVPEGSRFSLVALPTKLRYRQAVNALAGRGMLLLGRHEWRLAAEDALTIQRLVLLLGQGPLLTDQLVGISFRGIGAPLLPGLATVPSLVASDVRHLLSEFTLSPEMPGLAQTFDHDARFSALDTVLHSRQLVSQRGAGALIGVVEPEWGRQFMDAPNPLVYLLRPRPSASEISSRKGSQALALGARPGDGGHGCRSGSVDTSPEMAGFDGPRSVDTPDVMAGFEVAGRPRPRTATPAALRYALAVSRRTEVASSIRRSGQPSRPSVTTCCLLSSLKTLLIPTQEHVSRAFVNVSVRCQLMAGFQVSINGRFWVSPEDRNDYRTYVFFMPLTLELPVSRT